MDPLVAFLFARSLDLGNPQVALVLGLDLEMSNLNQLAQPRPEARNSN
jgi:hypothetical protein